MDLVRQLLLRIEDQGNDMNGWIDDLVVESFTTDQINHHVWLLADGGFITAIDLSSSDGPEFRPRCLTWQGHEFLGAIRDQEIWHQTLTVAKRGGTESLTALWEIAKAVGKKQIEKHLGVG